MVIDMLIRRKDGSLSKFDPEKIKRAISKSADRVLVRLSEKEKEQVCDYVKNMIHE